jgi:hypothetical protein
MPRHYLIQVLVSIDQSLNAMLGGWADETISSRAYRMEPVSRGWALARRAIDAAFFWQREHCLMAHTAERLRIQSPPEFRPEALQIHYPRESAMDFITRILPRDKLFHLLAGLLIGAIGTLLVNPVFGVALAIVAGGGKEWVWDAGINWWLARQGKPPAHDVDDQDFLYTVAGGGIAAAGITMVMAAVHYLGAVA